MVVRKAETVHSRPRHNNSGVGLLCDTSCCHREISSGAVRSELRPSCWDTHHSLLRGRLVSATTPEPINASTRACANPNSSNTWRNRQHQGSAQSRKQHSTLQHHAYEPMWNVLPARGLSERYQMPTPACGSTSAPGQPPTRTDRLQRPSASACEACEHTAPSVERTGPG